MKDKEDKRATRVAIKKPCKACPWKVGAHIRDIPGFSLEMSMNLLRLWELPGELLLEPSGSVMACHETTDREQSTCAGFAVAQRRAGYPNQVFRILASIGALGELPEDTDEELHSSMSDVVRKHIEQSREMLTDKQRTAAQSDGLLPGNK